MSVHMRVAGKYLSTLLFFTAVQALPAAVVTGSFGQDVPELRVTLQAPHHYLDGRADKYTAQPDAQGRFRFELDLPEPQIVFLHADNAYLPLFLAPADTLDIRTSLFDFPLRVAFEGPAAANNRLLQAYLRLANKDFSDFNNTRFKVGQTWFSAESDMQSYMDNLHPESYRSFLDDRKQRLTELAGNTMGADPGAFTGAFKRWLEADIQYAWAYYLLLYGQVNERRLNIQPTFFAFTNEVSYFCDCLNNEPYRQYLHLLMARQMAKTGNTQSFYAAEYTYAGQFLDGKPLAYLRSEIIYQAFNTDRYREILPAYLDFFQTNKFPQFEPKVTDLYAKVARNAPGAPAPPFSGAGADGSPVSLSLLKGKVVYLNFWASWCGACIGKMDYFDLYAAELAQNGVEIVNVSIDSDSERWLQAIREHAFQGRHLRSPTAAGPDIAKAYGVEAIPQYFIIARDGTFADKPMQHQAADIRTHLMNLVRNH